MDSQTERYRQVAEKELSCGNPRDPVLNQSIEAAAEAGSDVTEEYARRRSEQMLAHEEEHKNALARRAKLHRDLDEGRPGMLVRTVTLMIVIVAVVALACWLMTR